MNGYWLIAVFAPAFAAITVLARRWWKIGGIGLLVILAVLFAVSSVVNAFHRPEEHGIRALEIQQGGLWVYSYLYEINSDGNLHILQRGMFEHGREASIKVSRSVFMRAVDLAEPARANTSYRADPKAPCVFEHHTIQTKMIWTEHDGRTTSASQSAHCPLGIVDYTTGFPGYIKSLVGLPRGHNSWTLWHQREAVTSYLDEQVPASAWTVTAQING